MQSLIVALLATSAAGVVIPSQPAPPAVTEAIGRSHPHWTPPKFSGTGNWPIPHNTSATGASTTLPSMPSSIPGNWTQPPPTQFPHPTGFPNATNTGFPYPTGFPNATTPSIPSQPSQSLTYSLPVNYTRGPGQWNTGPPPPFATTALPPAPPHHGPHIFKRDSSVDSTLATITLSYTPTLNASFSLPTQTTTTSYTHRMPPVWSGSIPPHPTGSVPWSIHPRPSNWTRTHQHEHTWSAQSGGWSLPTETPANPTAPVSGVPVGPSTTATNPHYHTFPANFTGSHHHRTWSVPSGFPTPPGLTSSAALSTSTMTVPVTSTVTSTLSA